MTTTFKLKPLTARTNPVRPELTTMMGSAAGRPRAAARSGLGDRGLRPGLGRPASKAYLKALRTAEMAFWQEPGVTGEDSRSGRPTVHAVPARAAACAPASRVGGWLFATLAGVALLGVGWGMARGLDGSAHWDGFADLIRQLVS